MASSNVEIANVALQRLGSKTIVSLTEDSQEARAANAVFNHVIDYVTSRHSWDGAMKRVSLPALSEDPEHEFSNAYELPSDFLRLHEWPKEMEPFAIEDNRILTNEGAPLEVVYIRQVRTAAEMGIYLQEAVTWRLAEELAIKLTGSDSTRQRMAEQFRNTLNQVMVHDNQQRPRTDRYRSTRWLDARQNGTLPAT